MSEDQYSGSSPQSKPKLNWFDEWSAKGWGRHMVPLEKGTPKPNHKNWPEKIFTPEELDKARDAGMNLGIATGRRGQDAYTLVAFDIEDTELAPAIVQVLRARFPGLPMRYRRKPGGGFVNSTGCFIRVRDEVEGVAPTITKISIGKQDNGKPYVEVLAEGQQFQVGGPRHDKNHGGVAPEWRPGVPDLDTSPSADYREFLEVLDELGDTLRGQGVSVPGQQKGGVTPARPVSSTTNPTSDLEPIEEVSKLVGLVPNDHRFDDRKDWVDMAHRIYAAAGGDPGAEDIWLKWCAQRPQNPGEPERVWGSLTSVTNKPTGLRLFVKENYAGNYARSLFSTPALEEGLDPLNPVTGKPAFLAQEILNTARSTSESAVPVVAVESPWNFLSRITSVKPPKLLAGDNIYPGIVQLYVAAPGVGKSLRVLQLAWSAIMGLDPRTGATRDPAHCFCLMSEDREDQVIPRSHAILEHVFKIDPKDFQTEIAKRGTLGHFECGDRLPLVDIDPKSGRIAPTLRGGLLKLGNWLEGLIAKKDKTPVLIVFDMLRGTHEGDDNSRQHADAVHAIYKGVITTLARYGIPAGVVGTHHKTKDASQKASTSFAGAGSIGWYGNSRAVFDQIPVGQDFVKEERTKANYGPTGTVEYWRKAVVDTPAGPAPVLLPATKQDVDGTASASAFLHRTIVVKAHAVWMKTKPNIHAGKRDAKGFTHIGDFLRDLPEGASLSPAEVEKIIEAGSQMGAWKLGRVRLGEGGKDGSSKAGVIFDEGWTAPEEDTDEDGDA